ncbi:hypothetical protein [Falsiroseomonas sp. E2-1-a20]|uniref:hypothetical protein n=1 Tax=Falsiroseomonas sp. E2-1-a20 TaxID=3239300 RepID=UPI003F2BB430
MGVRPGPSGPAQTRRGVGDGHLDPGHRRLTDTAGDGWVARHAQRSPLFGGRRKVYIAHMQARKLFDFNDRRNAAEEARKKTAEKFQALKSRLDDPEVQRKLAEQKAIADARAARIAERAAEKAADAARIAAEKAAAEAAAAVARREAERLAAEEAQRARIAEIDAQHRAVNLDAEKKARALAMAAEQKAKRDARYAARKQRTK